ncbi:glycosyltransferase [Peribacillus sp. NJ11]|uniref:glycosyltransferase family 2 protein n=1 Tax=Peribacillus sp. NJ11 TaxID=3055861 RepID=UPI0025A20C5C|nr:glycosyltransferase [Peribacillus sp. NJ11]MDM5222795.1 glycosyltransferase [Peribacillus sp. NJ11]
MPFLSIIVPIYNVENYLPECIDSILVQTFTDIEVLLINDGSTDRCKEICEEYAQLDNRIRVINKKNEGVSSARNIGINNSRGEYIAFVDPDDTVEPIMYEVMISSLLQQKLDIVICPIRSINLINNTTSISSIWREERSVLNKNYIEENLIPSILCDKTFSLVSSVNKLYKKSLFDSLELRFDEKKHHGEDARLNFTLLTEVDKIMYVEQPLYNYYIRQRNSLTKTFREELYEYAQENKHFLLDLSKKYKLEKYENNIRQHFTTVSLGHMQEVVKHTLNKNRKYEIISKIMNGTEFKKDILEYKCPSFFYNLLKISCLLRNEKVFCRLVNTKEKIKNYSLKGLLK